MTLALDDWLSGGIYAYLLVVCRVGAVMMTAPGFSEAFVAPRARLGAALLASWPIALVAPGLPTVPPDQPAILVQEIVAELFTGALLGFGARLLFVAVRIAGQIAGQSMALSNIFATPGSGFDAGSVLTTWLSLGALALWFATGLHLLAIDAAAQSFGTIPAGQFADLGPAAEGLARLAGDSFALGVQVGAPFLFLGFIAYLALGLVNRLMASLPVFFVGMPAGILLGIWLFSAVVGSGLTVFGAAMEAWLSAPYE